VITSYALIRRDAERYRELEFDTLVLDEAQHIKNRQTQNAVAVKAVRAGHRLVLTGTPMENSVLDLWSIIDFLMPGYLGSATDFRERYEQPITRDKDEAVQARLGRRLRPFILRRLKTEVAKDLPAKLEQISYCELTDDQAEIYKQVLAVSRGLTLTGADTAVHFDPWWNPAVEDQATDRAHRIGQTRVVTSYKLITRGTVEEKILALQQKKRAIIKATLGGEETLADNLTWEEIQGLFE